VEDKELLMDIGFEKWMLLVGVSKEGLHDMLAVLYDEDRRAFDERVPLTLVSFAVLAGNN
jgi:hypothetical protein